MDKTLRRWAPLFVLPALICFIIAFLVPMIMGLVLSFFKFSTVTDGVFVGWSNYKRIFTDMDFVTSLWMNVRFTVVTVISINILAFFLALLLTQGVKGTNVYRTIFFMPNLIGGIVLGWIWLLIINGILLPKNATIITDAKYGFWGLVALANWQNIGYMMVIYIAGIQTINRDLIEAAQIDGANSWIRLKSVILPSVMPAITICTFLTLTSGFKIFDQNLALTAGNPARQTEMLALNIYNTFYTRTNFEGVGQAKAVLFTILVAIIALTQLAATRQKEVEA
ncbi:MAG: L-arabinose transport system permease protein AraP [Spirochaetes bacterium ADurb.Bin315]|jgi:raffinose/stachyose/melibiose transport system permease protein|nr:sugar ABC transporter permease [Spirochaetales bacterium]OQA42261.1 MAG: L-arabinose transport system permease protein AraP [Spirochaetes bacterium ADurb.Bin315]HNZ95294.1 sugar ABC transporter permease [Sphaerochaeta sp.]HPB41449.1 sugar ABC transporter permease [Sphaerochaeta sp.]HPY45496.1 sugar ABC transporter permease [Sphaerochaeta sp.]